MTLRFAPGMLLASALFAMGPVVAESINYDPRRAIELRACDEHQNHGRVEQARNCYSQLVNSSNAIAEAYWALGDLKTANERFRDITQANARAVQPRIRWARLFLQTHQYNDASQLFRDALKIFPDDVHAKVGLARVLAERFEGEAGPMLQEALQQDEELVEGHLLAAQLALESGQTEAAQKALERAGDLAGKQKQPPLEVFALLAALELRAIANLAVDQALARVQPALRRLCSKARALRNHAPPLSRGERRLLNRAVDDVQPDRWSAHAELGVNLLRLGQVDASRAALEKAYSGDPFSATTVNTLRVLDKLKNFSVIRAERRPTS